ncbi:urocanate hydratase [Haloarcula montana]|uniref:urocanate hydratase n=1 Tax=Haloarcula montana TaxID=3111776 RepID=UPI002D787FBA|nr:urocanate hydratase [Haloarcula sp. GH36]
MASETPSDVWREYRGARTGTEIECEGWRQEAALRMLNNNLDPEVAEDPQNLVVYGGVGQAARSWDAYDTIVETLRELESDETLVVQSGKPVGRLRTHEQAPRVLIANTNLVSKWDNWEEFRRLKTDGKMMMGNYTAGSWGYIGSQGVLQGTYETLAAVAEQEFDGDLTNRLVVTAGLGGMGGNQPLAVTMNGGVCLVAEVSDERIQRRIDEGYCQESAASVEEALKRARAAIEAGEARSIAVPANVVSLLEGMLDREFVPDVVTDMTAAHDELTGYHPLGYTIEEADDLRERDPDRYREESLDTMERHVRALLDMYEQGAVTFTYGNGIRGQVADRRGMTEAHDLPGFVPEYVRPLFCEGRGPFRWVALSGDPEDIDRTDALIEELFPENDSLLRWIDLAQEHVDFQGLPARVCWLGYQAGEDGLSERARFALRVNELVAEGEISAPIVVTRDQLDGGSIANPNEATEDMKDGTDAVADWPILNALLNCAAGADIVSLHSSAGAVGEVTSTNNHVVLDGSELAEKKARRVFDVDPASGVMRHADAGYEKALREADRSGIEIPMEDGPEE